MLKGDSLTFSDLKVPTEFINPTPKQVQLAEGAGAERSHRVQIGEQNAGGYKMRIIKSKKLMNKSKGGDKTVFSSYNPPLHQNSESLTGGKKRKKKRSLKKKKSLKKKRCKKVYTKGKRRRRRSSKKRIFSFF